MMSKELKASVLAKCEELASTSKYWRTISKEPFVRLLREVLDDKSIQWGLEMFKQGANFELAFTKDTESDSWVWPLAAQILGIQDSQKQQDKDALLKEFANGLERSLIDAYCTGDAINAIKRFAGLEIESSNALE